MRRTADGLKMIRKSVNPFMVANRLSRQAKEDGTSLPTTLWVAGFVSTVIPYAITVSVEGVYKLKESFYSKREIKKCEHNQSGTTERSSLNKNVLFCDIPTDECPYKKGIKMIGYDQEKFTICSTKGLVKKIKKHQS